MALIMHASALLALVAVANGQFSCPVAYDGKTDNPKCAGASDSTCSVATCCTLNGKGKLCSATGVVVGLSKCITSKKFYDLKKGASAYLGTDDNFRTTCCTSCSQATCSDWLLANTRCDVAKYFKPLNALGSSDCTAPSVTKIKEVCCAVRATCSSHTCSSGWTKLTNSDSKRCVGGAASCTDVHCCTPSSLCQGTDVVTGNNKCKGGSDTNKFFDFVHKGSSVVGTTDDNFRATCCTPCSAATCADWQPAFLLVFVTCSSTQMISGTTTLASSDCNPPTTQTYKQTCCIDIPSPPASMKCIDYVADTSTAFPKAFPVVGTLAGFMALVGAQVVFWA